MGSVYGCDRCSACCPWNKKRKASGDGDGCLKWIYDINFRNVLFELTPERILSMSLKDFKFLFSNTPVERVKLAVLQRNAKAILGEGAKCN